MKKILFLSLMAVTVLTGRSYAQQNALVAVLTHEGINTTFHGADALAEANEAAMDGDVITLSGGTFNGITLSKGITIRGAGMNRNEETNVDRTMINQLTIEDNTHDVAIENLYLPNLVMGHSLVHISFFKILVPTVKVTEGSNMAFVNCKIRDNLECIGNSISAFANCYIYKPNVAADESVVTFINCILRRQDMGNYSRYASFENCIIIIDSDSQYGSYRNPYYSLPPTATASYNLGLGAQLFVDITNATNTAITYSASSSIFKTYRADYAFAESETYELTDEAKATYIGSDGTEVGIYGGLYPFDSKPHHPIITKSNVAKKAEDGKLSVSFEVNGEE